MTNNQYEFLGLEKLKSKQHKLEIRFKKYNTIHKISIQNLYQGVRHEIRNAVDKNEFVICQFKEIHGDKFDYSLINYVNETTDIKIICKYHGIFELTPNEHKSKVKNRGGCQICSSGWNVERISNFINDIRNEDVLSMDPVELNMLIAQGKLPKELEELVFSSEGAGEHSLKSLKEKLGIDDNTENNEDELQRINEELEILTSAENQEINEALMT